MKNSAPETMGYKYVKKENNWVLKDSFNDNHRKDT